MNEKNDNILIFFSKDTQRVTNLGHSITGTDKRDKPRIYYGGCGEERDEGTLHMWGS